MSDTSLVFSILGRSNLSKILDTDASASRRLHTALTAVSVGVLAMPAAIGALGVAGAGAFALLGGGVAGLGLGILGLGVAAAATTKEVKTAFTDLATDAKAMIVEAAAPLVPVLTGIAADARTLLDPLGGALTSAFTGLAPALSSLASSGIAGLQPLIGAIVPISAAAEPLIVALGSGLQPVMAALATTLIMVSQTAAMFAPELEQIFVYAGQLITVLGPLMSSLIQLGAPIIGPLLALLVGLAGQLSTHLSPVFQRLGPILGDVLTKLYPLVGAFGGLLSAVLPILPPTAEFIGFLVGGLMPVLVPLVPVIAAAVAATRLWAIAQAAMNVVMMANPIGLAVIAVGALVAIFAVAWNSSEELRNAVMGAWDSIGNGASELASVVSGAWQGMWDKIDAFGSWVQSLNPWESISSGAEAMGNTVTGWWDGLLSFLSSIPGRIGDIASGMWDGVWNGFKDVLNRVIGGWNNLGFYIPPIDLPYVGRVWGGYTFGVPSIPYLAKGGTITAAGAAVVGEAGPELVSLPRGAQVTPLNRVSRGGEGGGVTNIFHVHGAIDPISVAREIEKVLRKYARETGRTALEF